MMRATVFLDQTHPHPRVMLEGLDLVEVNRVAQMTYDQARFLSKTQRSEKRLLTVLADEVAVSGFIIKDRTAVE